MKKNYVVSALALAALVGSASALPALARQDRGEGEVHAALVTPTVTEAEAIAKAQAMLPGTVVKVKLHQDHNRAVWRVKILSTDKTQRGDFRIDALTGAMLRSVIRPVHGLSDDGTKRMKLHDTTDDRGRRHGGHGADDK